MRLEKPSLTLKSVVLAWLCVSCGVSALGQHMNRHDERALSEDPRMSQGQLAPVLVGLGTHHHPVSTDSAKAQLFFDQGVLLTYGFNHQEALRAFKEAARLDPDCGMAYWGWALVLGPNLNLPMRPEVVGQAWEAIQLAMARIEQVNEKDADFIRALSRRYSPDPESDRAELDAAYAEAMRSLYLKYPEDGDAATLYAAALMNLSPWDYWNRDGTAKKNTTEILRVLEEVIEREPHHEGALHYYIHAVEAIDARRGERAADLLRGLAPGAGHLVHMPSHIYMQTGRYAEAFEVNVLASQADEGYITQCRAQGIYPLNYYPHNVHFLAWSAIMLGRSRVALQASRKVAAAVPSDLREDHWALYQTFMSMPYYTMVRFGLWKEILAEPLPDSKLRYFRGISRYARALAHLFTGNFEGAEKERLQLEGIIEDPGTPETLIGYSTALDLLTLAHLIVQGELAAKRKDFDKALLHLEKAVRLQDGLMYTEPPDWYYPVRHNLAAVLLESGRAGEAETVCWEDLKRYPENGFSLHGLEEALRAQGRESDAEAVAERFRQAWKFADVTLSSSRH